MVTLVVDRQRQHSDILSYSPPIKLNFYFDYFSPVKAIHYVTQVYQAVFDDTSFFPSSHNPNM